MRVKLAKNLGFCFGVKRAVGIASGLLCQGESKAYCLGPLIHNSQVVDKLSKSGLKVVDNLDRLKGGTLVIRSHGASPDAIMRAREKSMKIVDATCPFVKRLHLAAKSYGEKGYKVVIVGDAGHPEIEALSGVAGELVVVNDAKDVQRHNLNGKKVALLAQTTQSKANFKAVLAKLKKMRLAGLSTFDTICRDSTNRQSGALRLAKSVDVMVVLGGKNSANTKRLVSLCKKACARTYHVETAGEIRDSWFSSGAKVGIASGASTPDWVIKEVLEKLERGDK